MRSRLSVFSVIAGGLLFATWLPAAPQSEPNSGTAEKTVTIDNFNFAPTTLTVPAGTKVTWVNRDDAPHKVVSVGKTFAASPVLDTGERYSFSFAKPGTYEYFCSLHPKMVGKVVVQ
jgi:plastocyanin